ncbi:LysR family transcriptional regulator [Aureimonas sp. Leaf324]|jgi:DNA-binding transcriptional LysR family regulator|uniref:LysR family transcriptional regulator n=1 Tax=Aureimonas sp. Leaf324 TaxID=1736336 RepID=UPI0006FE1C2A|nr:LysR family transcriptional regulator [Aureimonas sp. Leaf324]KQQ90325.1 LysR family transcriptional regulator [Aureimonas sp. Leaf324]
MDLDRLAWDDLRLVGAVAETGTLPAAADRLHVAHSTVFRRLRQIEAAMGCALFERGSARLVPTSAGEEIAAVARTVAEAVDAAALRFAGREPLPSGEVRVTTNDSLLVHFLTPLFAGFRRHCPAVRLDVVLGNPALNLSKRDADVAIRATDRPPDTLVGRKSARIAWALYEGRAGEMEDFVSLGDAMGGMAVVRHVAATIPPERIGYRVNTVLGLAEAVEAGLGRGYLPCFVGDARASLRRLGDPDERFATDLWLLTHADLRHVPRVRALMDYLAERVAAERPLLEGERPQPG